MALCWRPFQLPPSISSALASILERLPVQLSGHPDDSSSSTVASREDEEDDDKHTKAMTRALKIRKALAALLHPAKPD
jgi:hypothetical protein